jgi:hypothetical protein
MICIDHVCIGCQNLYESAARLRSETKLDNYDGGWGSIGNALRIVPLGNRQYLEVESIIDQRKAAGNAMAQYFTDSTDLGDALIGWVLRVDTLDELTEIATRIGRTKNVGPFTARLKPDGTAIEVYATPPSIETWPKGIPNFVYWPETTIHPGNEAAPHSIQPQGIAWLELGGDERAIREWIGSGSDRLPLRFVEGNPGLRAVAIDTDVGVKVIRR